MKDSDWQFEDVNSLNTMMDLDMGGKKLWEPGELGAILQHQLAAPLECDLARFDTDLDQRLRAAETAGGPPVKTFSDLLAHPNPPVELLERTKQFAKACRSHPDSPLPDEIATVLYFLAIIAALLKCERRITRMDDAALKYSLQWALKLDWLDGPSRELLESGRRALDAA